MSGPGPELDAFVERYVTVWNEPDAAVRRRMIEELWAPDGANVGRGGFIPPTNELEVEVWPASSPWTLGSAGTC